jgi:hypothetical protein
MTTEELERHSREAARLARRLLAEGVDYAELIVRVIEYHTGEEPVNDHVDALFQGVLNSAVRGRWEVQTLTLCDGWVNCWKDGDGDPMTFSTEAEARAELDRHLADMQDAAAVGDMDDDGDPDDYRVVPMGFSA